MAPDWRGVARRLWDSPGAGWGLARTALLVPAGAFRAAVAMRNAAYDLGLARVRPLPLPGIGVGGLAVGGAGKSPLASYLAASLASRGVRPGILLRGYAGGDEASEHEARVPGAVVVVDPDRVRGAARAAARGAQVLVLDDCLQHRRVRPDVLLAAVAAERALTPLRPLPAGPWREGLGALARCDGVVVTYKAAPAEAAVALARRLARETRLGIGVAAELELASLESLVPGAGAARPLRDLAGRDVVAVCGIGEPEAFRAQLEAAGARVRLLAFGDHHAYDAPEAAAAEALAGPGGLVVTTAKDAVKLRSVVGGAAPAWLVARLEVRATSGNEDLARLLDRVARPGSNPVTAHASPSARRTDP